MEIKETKPGNQDKDWEITSGRMRLRTRQRKRLRLQRTGSCKLREILAAQAKEEADKTALKQEAEKYESHVTIPNTVEENTDITSLGR